MFSNENLGRKAFNSIFTAAIMSQTITPNTTALLTHEKRCGCSEIQQLPMLFMEKTACLDRFTEKYEASRLCE